MIKLVMNQSIVETVSESSLNSFLESILETGLLMLLLVTIIVLGGARKNQCWSGIPWQLQY
jgi:hypothetical protein